MYRRNKDQNKFSLLANIRFEISSVITRTGVNKADTGTVLREFKFKALGERMA